MTEYVIEPTTEQVNEHFGEVLEGVMDDMKTDVEILQVAGFSRDDILDALRVSASGDWGLVEEDGNVEDTTEKHGVTVTSARENWEAVQGGLEQFGITGEQRRAMASIIQTVHDRKANEVLGRENSPSGVVDVTVILRDD